MTIKQINGFKVHGFKSRHALLQHIGDQHKILIAMNAEKAIKSDETMKGIINANIGYPDGVGIVLAMLVRGAGVTKIPGVELWLDIIRTYAATRSFYLVGAKQTVIDDTVARLKAEFPQIRISGYRDGYLDEAQIRKLESDLQRLKPDIVFVAQGSPRQELLMHRLLKTHPALYMGLGGSFDVYSGHSRRAPALFVNIGMEWLYRLLKEPSRAGRYRSLLQFWKLFLPDTPAKQRVNNNNKTVV